jgi:ethanolamine ammonia-lyase small subunit
MSAQDQHWSAMRRLTAARIGLHSAGASLATAPLLEFKLAHAQARDAVLEPLDAVRLADELAEFGEVVTLASLAVDQRTYLMRPDLGRRLAGDSEATLAARHGDFDVAFVVADGLSARAAHQARPVLAATLPTLCTEGWRIAPLVIVRHGRVAIGDAIAMALGAACVVVLIGERPGLTAPDSMGAYLTWHPHARTTDAERNCISNIRPRGIAHDVVAFKIAYLLLDMLARRTYGVA